jgi:hypothetical protein
MPFYVTTPDGEKVLAESEKERLNQNTIEVEEKNKQPTETKPALIQQEEEIVSEDQKEIKIITTVCAR